MASICQPKPASWHLVLMIVSNYQPFYARDRLSNPNLAGVLYIYIYWDNLLLTSIFLLPVIWHLITSMGPFQLAGPPYHWLFCKFNLSVFYSHSKLLELLGSHFWIWSPIQFYIYNESDTASLDYTTLMNFVKLSHKTRTSVNDMIHECSSWKFLLALVGNGLNN